ncbi:MAG: succinate dehydrogenase [Polyangiaceae bacterium]|nr:succinate dehydrogenase [Polyangiaceae bacterium]
MTDTAHAESERSPLSDKNARSFLWRKLFSLTGVMPVAGFTAFHLWKNATALHGRDAFNQMVEQINAMPLLVVFEVALILLPILLHAVIGLKIVLDASYNAGTYKYARNWMFVMQRVAGVAALAFILVHLYQLRWQKLLGVIDPNALFDTLCRNLSGTVGSVPAVALLYVLGVAAVAFHLANGLWGFLCSWGITVSRRSQRVSATVLGLVGIAVFVLGANTAVYFATGSKLMLPPWGKLEHGIQHCPQVAPPVPAPMLPPAASVASPTPSVDAPTPPAPEPDAASAPPSATPAP